MQQDKSGARAAKEYRDLIKAYILGDKLLDTKFQNSVIDAMVETCSDDNSDDAFFYYPNGQAINYAYENTMATSKIRSLLVDMWVSNAETDWFESPNYPKDFFLSVVKGIIEKDLARDGSPPDASKYYVLESDNDNGNGMP